MGETLGVARGRQQDGLEGHVSTRERLRQNWLAECKVEGKLKGAEVREGGAPALLGVAKTLVVRDVPSVGTNHT